MRRRLVLLFDCFIISERSWLQSIQDRLQSPDARFHAEYRIRSQQTCYRYRSKLDITLYTLTSYAAIPFDQIIIRFECEDVTDSPIFLQRAQVLFPHATFIDERSDTAAKYLEALRLIDGRDNPWVFFCPNNDHPFLANPSILDNLLLLAQEVEILYQADVISVLYSHFTESINNRRASSSHWAFFSHTFNHVLAQTFFADIVSSQHFLCDSIKIYRYSDLESIFKYAHKTRPSQRLIRLEESGLYMSSSLSEISIHPNFELCRHYDSIMPYYDSVPMLFIPPGFETRDIHINYLSSTYSLSSVNVNPRSAYVFNGGTADLRCFLSELPYFWKNLISSIEIATPSSRLSPIDDIHSEYHDLVHVFPAAPVEESLITAMRKLYSFTCELSFPETASFVFDRVTLPPTSSLSDSCLNSLRAISIVSGSVLLNGLHTVLQGNVYVFSSDRRPTSISSFKPSGACLILMS